MNIKDLLVNAVAALVMVMSVLNASGARAADGAATPASLEASAPEVVIKQTVQRVLNELATKEGSVKNDPEQLYALVNETVVPHLDMRKIAQIVLGKHGRKADPAIFQRFLQAFQTVLVRTYATSLKGYAGETVDFPQAAKVSDKGTASVQMVIRQAGTPGVVLTFRLHNRSGPWLVYDIQVEGISLVANYRSEYSAIVSRDGLEALVARLEAMNEETRIASK
jgi:phospholipid transport system substrate-binding protein